MLLKNTVCPKCGSIYDATESFCPKCQEKNPNPASHHRQHGLVWLPKWQEITFFLVGWLGLKIISFIMQLIFYYMYKNGEVVLFSAICNFSAYFIIFAGMISLIIQNHKKILSPFKKFVPYAAGVGIGIATLVANGVYYSIISNFYTFGVNANESLVQDITISYPVLAVIFFVIIGPICEELTYRLGFFSFFARIKKWVAYVATVLVFALIHFDFFAGSSEAYLVELLNLPSYLIGAAGLCLAYDYFGLPASLTAHILNNFISVMGIFYKHSLGLI